MLLANLAVSNIIHADAGVVLSIHFKNLSVQKQYFYGSRYNHKMYNVPIYVEIFLTNLAVSGIIHAGVVLPIHFKNLSVQNRDFYGGRYNHEMYNVSELMLNNFWPTLLWVTCRCRFVLSIHFKNWWVQNQDCHGGRHNHERYNVFNLCWTILANLAVSDMQMQELFRRYILRMCQYRIGIFMEVGINHEMYNVSEHMLKYF